jgi:very-short-patch-repair endonuclease
MRRARTPDALMTGAFTTHTAECHGVTRLRPPTWRQLLRNVWIAAHLPIDRATWLAAARLVLPVDAVLCGLSAVDAYEVDVRQLDDMTVHAAFDGQVPRRRKGMVLRQLALRPEEATTRGGWLVTTPLRTAFDCARWLPLVEAVVVIDALAHAGYFGVDELLAFAAAHPGWRWVTRVAKAAMLADPRSESPMESRLRLLLVRAGLTGLQPQLEVFAPDGSFVGRLDLAFEAQKVAVEYDGAWHWRQRRADDRRRDAVRALGWTVIVVSAEDFYGDPAGIVARVCAALATAAA